MVGIPRDRVSAGMLECGCYRTAIHPRVVELAGGVAFRVWCGVYFLHITQHPTVVPESLLTKQRVWCVVPAANFFSFGFLCSRP